MKNVGNSSDGRSQGVPKISGHQCIGRIWGHCAVIFAIAQLSCFIFAVLVVRVHHIVLTHKFITFIFAVLRS